MSGRGLTKQGTQNFVKFGIPFMSFVLIGSYGLSEWVGAKIRIKDEKRQQVTAPPPPPTHLLARSRQPPAARASLTPAPLPRHPQEKVLDELRAREKRDNKRILSKAPKQKQRFNAEDEYEKMMAKVHFHCINNGFWLLYG